MDNSTTPAALRGIDTFPIHTAVRRTSRTWKPSEVTFDDIVTWVENPRDFKDCGGFVGGTLEGNVRNRKNLLSRSLITLDADKARPGFLGLVDLTFPYQSIWHSTYSHTPDAPRYRGIIVPDRELTPAEYPVVVRQLMAELNAQQDTDHDQFDGTAVEPERIMYMPSTQDPAWFEKLILRSNAPLPVDDYLARAGQGSVPEAGSVDTHDPLTMFDVIEGPTSARTSRTKQRNQAQSPVQVEELGVLDDPFSKPSPIGEFNSAHPDFAELVETFGLPYEDAGNGRWHYIPASSQAGMAELRPGRWYSNHASDPAHGHAHTAFDIVRIHKFGALDSATPPGTPVAQLPSHRAMVELARDELGTADQGLLGQQRIAVRFAQQSRGKCAYLYGAGWRVWTGRVWAADKSEKTAYAQVKTVVSEAFRASLSGDGLLKAAAMASSSASGIRGVLDIAARELLVEEMDTNPWVLNCANGTLDLRTLELRPHDPADQLSRITAAAYRPEAHSPKWEKFIREAIPDPEVRGFLQRFIGVSLIGTPIEHFLCILHGQLGRNGKSTFAETLSRALGDYADTTSNQLLIENKYGNAPTAGDSSAMMQLKGLRLAVMSEISSSAKMHESRMKELTGGDTIQAKLMRRDPVTFEPTHSFLMLTNDLPSVAAESQAVWSRIRIVPFPNSFEGAEDTGLKESLKGSQEALDAVLAWAVAGLREWQKRGLAAPEAVMKEVQEYRDENNPVAEFVAEMCTTGNRAEVLKPDLHQAYNSWAEIENKPALSRKAFPQKLDAAVPGLGERMSSGVRSWVGIELKDGDLL